MKVNYLNIGLLTQLLFVVPTKESIQINHNIEISTLEKRNKISTEENNHTFYLWDFISEIPTTENVWGFDFFEHETNLGLNIKSSSSSPAILSMNTFENADEFTWEFGLKVKGNLSSSNLIRLYIGCDQVNFKDNHNGYHLQIDGSSGNHYYKFYKQNGSKRSLIFTSPPFPNLTTGFEANIQIKRDQLGAWTFYTDEEEHQSYKNIIPDNLKIQDKTIPIHNFSGAWISFTSTRRKDFQIKHISYLNIPQKEIEPETYQEREYKDVIINEIMANPKGNIAFPDVEFVELYNQTSDSISLKNWEYSSNTTKTILKDIIMLPHSYLILCKEIDTLLFDKNLTVLGIHPWPNLTNTGNTLTLKDHQNKIIDQVEYTDKWYTNPSDKQGGKSLELAFLIDPCDTNQPWASSTDSLGSTPGKKNSIGLDSIPSLQLLNIKIETSSTIRLGFNRKISLEFEKENILFVNTINMQEFSIDKLSIMDQEIEIIFNEKIENSTLYKLTLQELKDCLQKNLSFDSWILNPDNILKNDLLISEVLFDPRNKGAKFVEIYNASQKILDLSQLMIGNSSQNKWTNLKDIAVNNTLIYPSEFKVITNDPENIMLEYPNSIKNSFIKIASLPSYAQTEGTIVLVNKSTIPPILVDSFTYNHKMHNQLLKNTKGYSLERVSFEVSTNTINNFTSGPASDFGATPGYKSLNQAIFTENRIEITNRIIQRNSITQNSEIQIDYQLSASKINAQVVIIDYHGNIVHHLIRNTNIPSKGQIKWDGTNQNGRQLPPGLYTIIMEFYNEDGWKKNSKKTCIILPNK